MVFDLSFLLSNHIKVLLSGRVGLIIGPVLPPRRLSKQCLKQRQCVFGWSSDNWLRQSTRKPLRNSLVWSCLCQVSKVNEKDLQDQQCEYSPQALREPTSTISCLHDRFLDGQLLPTPHLYFLYLFLSSCLAKHILLRLKVKSSLCFY